MTDETTRAGANPANQDVIKDEDLFVPPVGTEALLDAQLAQGLRIMRDLAAFVRFPHLDMTDRMHIAQTLGSLMQSSATLGKVATRLKHGPEETHHRITVCREDAPAGRGEGVPQSRKRIKR
jgi:hypothetical protein